MQRRSATRPGRRNQAPATPLGGYPAAQDESGWGSRTAKFDLHHWGRSSAGRAPDWQSGGSWVQVPSPPPKFLIRGSELPCRTRRIFHPRAIHARHLTRPLCRATATSRLTRKVHPIGNMHELRHTDARQCEASLDRSNGAASGGHRNLLLRCELRASAVLMMRHSRKPGPHSRTRPGRGGVADLPRAAAGPLPSGLASCARPAFGERGIRQPSAK